MSSLNTKMRFDLRFVTRRFEICALVKWFKSIKWSIGDATIKSVLRFAPHCLTITPYYNIIISQMLSPTFCVIFA